MSLKNEIAARITHHSIQLAISRRRKHNAITYHVHVGQYFDNEEQGKGYELLDGLSETLLSVLAEVVALAQAEIDKLRAADNASKDTDPNVT